MKWLKYTIETTVAAEDFISEMLNEIGIEGIEIHDNVPLTEEDTKGMFIDILPELPPDDGGAQVVFYLDEDLTAEQVETVLAQVRAGLKEVAGYCEIGAGTITADETEDKDWINNWKEFFKPFTVDGILIKPTWEEIPEAHRDKLMIEIDPGTAFGTGSHETTQLCIRALQKYVKAGDRVLDIGTGSGILGITAIKLGASQAFGTDLDENAVAAAIENVAVNHIPADRFPVVTGNILEDEDLQRQAGIGTYDVAVANILAPVIILLTGEADRHLKPGGIFITSGIIDLKEEAVKAAFACHPVWEILETRYQGEWVSVVARKRG